MIKPILSHYSFTDEIEKTAVHLSYKDILLVPFDDDFCTVESRSIPDISTFVCGNYKISIPLLSAPMDSITTSEMVQALDQIKALGVYTRWIGEDQECHKKQVTELKKLKKLISGPLACAIGVKGDIYEKASELCDVGVNIICLDIANGNHIFMRDSLNKINKLKQKYNISVIAGNVATGKSAIRLAEHGADAVKVGIGPGAVCSTRKVTGFGVPQLTALMDCARARYKTGYDFKIIADGGCRNPDDVVKALWAGADSVMAGFIFAGHVECPTIDGKNQYRGMSSREVNSRKDVAPEGICLSVKAKGSVKDTIQDYASAIRAACSMANAYNLDDLRKNVKAIRVSTVTHDESDPINSI